MIAAACNPLNSNPAYWARWVSCHRPDINHDDADALALLTAISADPDEIMAE